MFSTPLFAPSAMELRCAALERQLQEKDVQISRQARTLQTLVDEGAQTVIECQAAQILTLEETIDEMKTKGAAVFQQEQIYVQQKQIEKLEMKLKLAEMKLKAKVQAERQNLLDSIASLEKNKTAVGDDPASLAWLQDTIEKLTKLEKEKFGGL